VSQLTGQTALVTGSSSGIGARISKAMASAGANVVVNYPVEPEKRRAEQIRNEINAFHGHAIAIKADVSKEDEVLAMFEKIMQEFGTLDILIANAGIQSDAKFTEMSIDKWRSVIDVNLTGAFLCAREAAKEFLRRGVVPERSAASGKIIFTSSVHQSSPWAGHANYAASKGGMNLLMKTIAQELAPYRVRANAIAPGAIKTDINRKAWETPEEEEKLLKLIPYGRVGETKDIGSVAVWLASDDSDYITGTTIYVDGGMLLYPGFRTGD
jgi:glucose 1-dehydrogenase